MTTLINATKVEDGFTLEFVSNPKRAPHNAYQRYDKYQVATTMAEYLELADKKFAKADLRYDESKGFLKVFDEEGNWMNAPADVEETDVEEEETEV